LGIDLSGNPGAAQILAGQRGAEIEVSAPNPIAGRILGIEYRPVGGTSETGREAYLSLYTEAGVRIIALKDIGSFSFKDPVLNADLKRALDLIALNRASRTRSLLVKLPGSGSRQVSLSYVIAVPVWKVSYRLDLGQSKPLFQGWAIIDNDSDTDWNNVELSLVSGRPVSFIQELYPPYYLNRPTLPLAIAGVAQARSHASGYGRQEVPTYEDEEVQAEAMFEMAVDAKSARNYESVRSAPAPMAPVQAAATGSAAGDQFAFTVRNPVTLLRRQSAMIPLVNSNIEAQKTLILSGSKAMNSNIHPELAAELTNTTGMKLPAGPITVFDGGTYAGDALLEFFSDKDKRFISYGEDLSVNASAANVINRVISTVTVNAGVMIINRRQIVERTYKVKNGSSESRRLIIEHPITGGAELTEPKTYLEKTDSIYRFVQNLSADKEISFIVKEESPISERIILTQLRLENFVSYSTNQEIPANVRRALAQAVELRQKNDVARQALTELESRRTRLYSDQDRVRSNLSAVGSSSDLGREYMRRMTELDKEIDGLKQDIEKATALVQSTQKDVENYIAGLKL
jgi:hypothetical protein